MQAHGHGHGHGLGSRSRPRSRPDTVTDTVTEPTSPPRMHQPPRQRPNPIENLDSLTCPVIVNGMDPPHELEVRTHLQSRTVGDAPVVRAITPSAPRLRQDLPARSRPIE